MAQRDAQKIEALQKSLEARKQALEAMLQSTTGSVASRSEADEEFKRLIKLMSERIKDLQDELRQLNRLVSDLDREMGHFNTLDLSPFSCISIWVFEMNDWS